MGAVLYRALTGQPYLPFDLRDTPGAQADNVLRIRNQQPPPPSTHNRRIPAWMDRVVLRALAKRPDDRYETARELRAALLRQEAQTLPTPAAAELQATQTPFRPGSRLAPSQGERAPLPALFWWLLGAATVLLLAIAVALVMTLDGPGGGGHSFASTATRMMATAATQSSPAPIGGPLGSPTPLAPTVTPTPPVPNAGEIQIRARDRMEMVYVPAGEFLMGSADADSRADDDEKPQHSVELEAFWIDRTEVTNAQYGRFLNILGGHEGRCAGQDCIETKDRDGDSHLLYQDQQYTVEDGYQDHPVTEVTWYGARTYCEWAGARLPTEAEWEKAARGTRLRLYPWGNGFACDRGNFDDEQEVDSAVVAGGPRCDGYMRTAPVGSFPAGASPYDAVDMAGNVWEWVADWYNSGYYSHSPSQRPQGPSSGEHKVLRSGSWRNNEWGVRTANRNSLQALSTTDSVGFRCAGE